MGINRTPPPGGGNSPLHTLVTSVTSHTTTTTTLSTSTTNFTTNTTTGYAVCTPTFTTSASSYMPRTIPKNDIQRHLGVNKISIDANNISRSAQSQTISIPPNTVNTSLSSPPHTKTVHTHHGISSGNYLYSSDRTQTEYNSGPHTNTTNNSYSQNSSSVQVVISAEANENENQNRNTDLELLERNKYYENLCAKLRKDIDLLKEENSKLKPNNAQSVSYETDEDELNIEVGCFERHAEEKWQTISNKKRIRDSPGKENSNQKHQKTSSYWLSKNIATTNRFAPLQTEPECQNIPSTRTELLSKPPPIFVDNVSNIQPLISLLDKVAKNQFELKNLKNQQVKIIPKNPETYKKILSELEKKNTEFFTYKLKEERSFKVILRNLHPSVDTEELKKELLERGHEVTNIWNIRKRGTKEPLPLFDIDLKLSPNNKEIYTIKSLMYTRIIFEPPRPKKTIPQCTNCQQYGHTKSFCKRKPKCIKCAGSHLSKDCVKKNWETQVKCALCNGNHPANYKGCSIYKQIYESQYGSRRRFNDNPSTQNNDNSAPEPNPSVNSQAINPTNSQNQYTQDVPSNSNLPTQEKSYIQPLYSKVVSGPTQNQYHIPQAAPINLHSQTNQNQQLNSNFTSDMISALRSLMQQMQQVTSLLMNLLSKVVQT